MKPTNQGTGKILYAATFLVIVPAGLWFWAENTGPSVQLPALESKPAGITLAVAGLILMVWAMLALKRFGKGLPMNAYPPPLLVSKGPYRVFRHPIYWGFGMFLAGSFIAAGSASGLWLVTPLAILGMTALVMGYERLDLRQRFPGQVVKTILDLPENNAERPGPGDRLAALAGVVILLVFCNFLIATLAKDMLPAFEDTLRANGQEYPVLAYAGIVFLVAVPFFLERKELLREWTISARISLSLLLFMALQYPEAGARYFLPGGSPLLAVPLFLVFLSLKSLYRQPFRKAAVFTVAGLGLVAVQLNGNPFAVTSLLVSVPVFLLSGWYQATWHFIKDGCEKIANSWRERTFRKIRVINHGVYAGLGTFFVILAGGLLAGTEYTLALAVCSVLLTVCAALWAQVIEGSEKLKRPFGYYGSVVGLLFGALVVWFMGLSVWVVMGVASVVMPWGQAIGRLRCLVNGCCHGGKTDCEALGIRFSHPRSRVNNISGLKGELLHPTQLYSILWLFFTGILLFTLWIHHVSYSLIFGLYLVLTSLGRFVEEAYRGETQTPVLRGLRLYQWVAVAAGLAGIVITCIRVDPVAVTPGISWDSLGLALAGGLFNFFAMGVDFPYSNARFSRLV